MITEGEAAILLETTQRAFRNQSQSKQRSTLVCRITGKNGAEFKNHVENRHEQTRAKRGFLRVKIKMEIC